MFCYLSCCSAVLFQPLQQHTDCFFNCCFSQQYCAIGKGQLDAVLTNLSTLQIKEIYMHSVRCVIYISAVAFEVWLHWDINIYSQQRLFEKPYCSKIFC